MFREAGGMPSIRMDPLSGRCLSLHEREEIALLRGQDLGVREIACRIGRSASTVSRELRRNAATRSGYLHYRASTAQWHAQRRACRPKPAKLAMDERLRMYVQDRLSGNVIGPDGTLVPGPAVEWIGRRHGPRKVADGRVPVVRNRSPTDSESISRTMNRCGYPTKRSTRRSILPDGAVSPGMRRHACGPSRHCGSREHAPADAARSSSTRTS